MKIYLIRHGAKEKEGFDGKLIWEGIEQIRKLAERFSNSDAKVIYSSANPRSLQTAQIIREYSKLPLIQINSIREIEKETFFNFEEAPEEEKLNLENLKIFLNELMNKNENCILAMHAGINRAIISLLLDIPLKKTIVFTQSVANITELEYKEVYGEKRWCLNLLNDINHLK